MLVVVEEYFVVVIYDLCDEVMLHVLFFVCE